MTRSGLNVAPTALVVLGIGALAVAIAVALCLGACLVFRHRDLRTA